MNRKVFLAYPLTTSLNLFILEQFVRQLREGFEAAGWDVLPVDGGFERINAATRDLTPADLLASNVAAVTGSDLLVVLSPPALEPSSIWIELGMALAYKRPIIIIGGNDLHIPFLGRLAVSSDFSHPNGIFLRVNIPPPNIVLDEVILQLIDAANFLVSHS